MTFCPDCGDPNDGINCFCSCVTGSKNPVVRGVNGGNMIKTKEHYELIDAFELQFKHKCLDKERKELWTSGAIYQNGEVNQLFLAFRLGYSYGRAV